MVLYGAQDDTDAAIALAGRIIDRVENTSHFPLSNRVVPEKADGTIREAILNPYRIVYAVHERRKVIHVLRVWHSSRGIPELD